MSTCALRLRRYACRRLSSASVRALVPSSRSLIFFPLTALIRFFSLSSESEASEPEPSLDDDEDERLDFLLFLLPFLLFLLSFLLLLLLFFFRLSFFRFLDVFSFSSSPRSLERFFDFLRVDSESDDSPYSLESDASPPAASSIAEGGRPTASSRSRCDASESFALGSTLVPYTIHRLFGSDVSTFGLHS